MGEAEPSSVAPEPLTGSASSESLLSAAQESFPSCPAPLGRPPAPGRTSCLLAERLELSIFPRRAKPNGGIGEAINIEIPALFSSSRFYIWLSFEGEMLKLGFPVQKPSDASSLSYSYIKQRTLLTTKAAAWLFLSGQLMSCFKVCYHWGACG